MSLVDSLLRLKEECSALLLSCSLSFIIEGMAGLVFRKESADLLRLDRTKLAGGKEEEQAVVLDANLRLGKADPAEAIRGIIAIRIGFIFTPHLRSVSFPYQ